MVEDVHVLIPPHESPVVCSAGLAVSSYTPWLLPSDVFGEKTASDMHAEELQDLTTQAARERRLSAALEERMKLACEAQDFLPRDSSIHAHDNRQGTMDLKPAACSGDAFYGDASSTSTSFGLEKTLQVEQEAQSLFTAVLEAAVRS